MASCPLPVKSSAPLNCGTSRRQPVWAGSVGTIAIGHAAARTFSGRYVANSIAKPTMAETAEAIIAQRM